MSENMRETNNIKETLSFRAKNLDNYLSSMKKLLIQKVIQKAEIEDRLKILNKNLKNTEKKININNDFLVNNKEVKIWYPIRNTRYSTI